MRIILVHNYYGSESPSGENQVFELERDLLQSRGHWVNVFTRHSDQIRAQGTFGVLKGGASTPWNFFVTRELKRLVKNFNPDVVHVHNTFPLISPAIFHGIGDGVAKVLTLHNYRLFCSGGTLNRNGMLCTACIDLNSSFSALKYGCYRNSRVATFPLALSVGLHKKIGTWQEKVDAFIVFSEFQRQLMTKAGLPKDRVHIKPNFYQGMPQVVPWSNRDNYIVFVGRLSSEKGLITLLNAWAKWRNIAPELRIVGDGPLRSKLEYLAQNLPVRFLGSLSSEEAQAQIGQARLLILPSESYEGFPMVIREAFALGTPVATSNLGPLPSIVHDGINGVLFEPFNAVSLLNVVEQAWLSPNLLMRYGNAARVEFEQKYTEQANYHSLINIYEKAVELARDKMKGHK